MFCSFVMDLLYSSQATGRMLGSKKGIAVLREKIIKYWTGAGKLQLHTELRPWEDTPIWPLIDLVTSSLITFFSSKNLP